MIKMKNKDKRRVLELIKQIEEALAIDDYCGFDWAFKEIRDLMNR